MRDNQGVQLARRGFLRLISALPAFAVFRSLPVQAAHVSEAPACEHGMWLVEPKHSTKLCAGCGIRRPLRPNAEFSDILVTPEQLSALEDAHTADQRWMTRDGGFRFGQTPNGPTYRERRL